VNTFLNPNGDDEEAEFTVELARSTDDEKQSQIRRLREFQQRHASESEQAIARLKQAATNNENVFAVLMDAVQCCSLGQITNAFFEVGGQYRRNM
jgi:methylmalonyl-CoA mutase